jgi:nucleoside-diphosphate-sugar epimerase
MGWEHVIPQFVMRLSVMSAPDGETLPFQIQGDGTQTRAFIYIDDFTAALMRVIDQGRHLNIYNIGTSQEIQIREVAARVAECMGKSISIVPGPEAAGGAMRRCPDVRKLAALGFQPQWRFDQALRATVDWYRSRTYPGDPPLTGTEISIR